MSCHHSTQPPSPPFPLFFFHLSGFTLPISHPILPSCFTFALRILVSLLPSNGVKANKQQCRISRKSHIDTPYIKPPQFHIRQNKRQETRNKKHNTTTRPYDGAVRRGEFYLYSIRQITAKQHKDTVESSAPPKNKQSQQNVFVWIMCVCVCVCYN